MAPWAGGPPTPAPGNPPWPGPGFSFFRKNYTENVFQKKCVFEEEKWLFRDNHFLTPLLPRLSGTILNPIT